MTRVAHQALVSAAALCSERDELSAALSSGAALRPDRPFTDGLVTLEAIPDRSARRH
jgi:hypothetical protein